MANKNTFINNKTLKNNFSLLKDTLPSKRCLILNEVPNISGLPVLTDYFDAVISSNLSLLSYINLDFFVNKNESIYESGLFSLNKYTSFTNTFFLFKYDLIKELVKLNSTYSILTSPYLSSGDTSNLSSVKTVYNINAGLSANLEEVNLARVLGCTSIYTTDSALTGATLLSEEGLLAFCLERDLYKYKNFITSNRKSYIEGNL